MTEWVNVEWVNVLESKYVPGEDKIMKILFKISKTDNIIPPHALYSSLFCNKSYTITFTPHSPLHFRKESYI